MQNELFIESLSDALSAAISQLGGMKRVGCMLWPEKSAREAGNQLTNCLNPDHAQKLSLEQIDYLIEESRNQGIHDIHKYLCDRYGYEFKPVTKEVIQATIEQRMQDCLKQFQQSLKEWERIK